ncbi:MAG: hypothetical protein ACI4WS_00505 [Oscillospiraceae bacterium]
MSKSGKNVDYAAALENSFARWDYIHEHGCSDPFWADGVNMNLVRNHIIYYKQQLSEEATLFLLPEAYYREVPPEVDNNFMARPDEIRLNAARSMQIIDADENLKFVREQSVHLTEKQFKQLCIPAILGYAESLRRAISEDDLLTMRRYENPNGYLESFQSAAQKLRSPEILAKMESIPADEDEEYEDLDECDCSPNEQIEADPAPEVQENYVQLTLF